MAGMPRADARCAPEGGPIRERNPFPVFPGDPKVEGPMKRSRMGRRRALVLGAVHVLIAGHILHWQVAGRTLSPVEPSEAMRTLELGQVNAGAIFFALAILSTLVLGRFFCGWGCHVVALQDLCGWLMRKAGIRPRPFRARLLGWVPLALALYMFVWPTAKRWLVVPWAKDFLPERGFLAAPAPFPGFSDHLTTEHFWETFAGVAVAVPFLLVCGFAVVWLLGSKGFCTYGCPYGAFFGLADRTARGRIRVDENCNGCGHCTAVCTSNVRVHDEVRRHGMVVDAGCMKCLDCVSTCPKDALRFGFGPPAPRGAAPAERRWDLDAKGEVAVLAVFLGAFAAWRGAYGLVPMLMAVGVGLTVTGLAWVAWRLVTAPDVSLQGFALRRDGRWRAPGALAFAGAGLAVLLTVQAGAAGLLKARADAADAAVRVTREAAFAGRITDADRAAAARAAAWYRRADGLTAGGIGLLAPRDIAARRAWLALVLGRPAEALAHLDRAAIASDPAARLDRARILSAAGRHAEAASAVEAVIADRPDDPAAHRAHADVLAAAGDTAGVARALVVVVNLDPSDTTSRRRLAATLDSLGRPAEALRYR